MKINKNNGKGKNNGKAKWEWKGKKLLVLTAIVTLLQLLTTPSLVLANDGPGVVLESDIGLQPLKLPTFLSWDAVRNFSFVSYIALGINILFVGIAIMWIVIVIRAAIGIIRSQGDSKPLEEGSKRFGAVFWSITLLFGFVAVLSVVAGFFGFGNFWEWPEMFAECQDGRYYFTVLQEYSQFAEPRSLANSACFGSGGIF